MKKCFHVLWWLLVVIPLMLSTNVWGDKDSCLENGRFVVDRPGCDKSNPTVKNVKNKAKDLPSGKPQQADKANKQPIPPKVGQRQ
jgi:hypothetical protein